MRWDIILPESTSPSKRKDRKIVQNSIPMRSPTIQTSICPFIKNRYRRVCWEYSDPTTSKSFERLQETIESSCLEYLLWYLEICDAFAPKKRIYKKLLHLKTHKQPLTNCCFSKYGQYFATSSYDRTCKIWNSSTGNLICTLSGHRNAVFCANFSHFSDQNIIATGSFDNTSRIWNISGKMLQTFTGHTGEITAVKFNPNGTYLSTSSLDSTARIWDI